MLGGTTLAPLSGVVVVVEDVAVDSFVAGLDAVCPASVVVGVGAVVCSSSAAEFVGESGSFAHCVSRLDVSGVNDAFAFTRWTGHGLVDFLGVIPSGDGTIAVTVLADDGWHYFFAFPHDWQV